MEAETSVAVVKMDAYIEGGANRIFLSAVLRQGLILVGCELLIQLMSS